MTEQWQELKETITEMRDNGGTGTQQDVCRFLVNYMETLEKQMQQPCEGCISRKQALDDKGLAVFHRYDDYVKMRNYLKSLPSVIPKYTDEEIDKIQEIEQAYVDKMVELAVEEIKERYSDAIGKMKKAIDEMTEIHSDGEFYIKNVDAKWIISKYLCGGGEDETNN